MKLRITVLADPKAREFDKALLAWGATSPASTGTAPNGKTVWTVEIEPANLSGFLAVLDGDSRVSSYLVPTFQGQGADPKTGQIVETMSNETPAQLPTSAPVETAPIVLDAFRRVREYEEEQETRKQEQQQKDFERRKIYLKTACAELGIDLAQWHRGRYEDWPFIRWGDSGDLILGCPEMSHGQAALRLIARCPECEQPIVDSALISNLYSLGLELKDWFDGRRERLIASHMTAKHSVPATPGKPMFLRVFTYNGLAWETRSVLRHGASEAVWQNHGFWVVVCDEKDAFRVTEALDNDSHVRSWGRIYGWDGTKQPGVLEPTLEQLIRFAVERLLLDHGLIADIDVRDQILVVQAGDTAEDMDVYGNQQGDGDDYDTGDDELPF